MIVRLNDIIDRIESLIDFPTRKTFSLGFPPLDQHYKIVRGATTYIAGIPSHGKSEWLYEMLIRLSELYGWKHLIYSPESGSADEIYTELLCKYQSKLLRENAFNRITKDLARKDYAFIHSHFFVRETEENAPSPASILDECKSFMSEEHIDTLSIDPWNEATHDFFPYGGRQDEYLSHILGRIRRFSNVNDIHTFIVAHPRTLQKNKDGFYDPPTAFEFSGGATWFAKSMSILCVHRPLEFSDSLYERTFVDIIVQKTKPKAVGVKGKFECDYDLNTGRYKARPGDVWYENPVF